MPRDLKIKDDQGRSMSAMIVFAESIKFLKNHMMGVWAKRDMQKVFKTDEIQWVLTVPAIWSDAAKQFMRESAIKVVHCLVHCILIVVELESSFTFRTNKELKYTYMFTSSEGKYCTYFYSTN